MKIFGTVITGANVTALLNVESIREYCLRKKGAQESFPFDNETLVFKVGGKIFLLMGLHAQPVQFNVKCEPDRAIALREAYAFITPGFHMNKAHWNTVVCDGRARPALVWECIDHSYDLIVSSLPLAARKKLGAAR